MNFGAKIEIFGKSTLKISVKIEIFLIVFDRLGAKIEIFGKSTLKKISIKMKIF